MGNVLVISTLLGVYSLFLKNNNQILLLSVALALDMCLHREDVQHVLVD